MAAQNNAADVEFTDPLAVIGCGRLGTALIGGFCAHLNCDLNKIYVNDLSGEKSGVIARQYGVTAADAHTAIRSASVIVLAVKPGAVVPLFEYLGHALIANKLFISVAAGLTLAEIRRASGSGVRLVRVMPNVACLYGAGISSIYGEDRESIEIARRLFSCVGMTLLLEREAQIDAATALGASGPAFIFYLVEGLMAGALKMGLAPAQAEEMARQMAFGAGTVLRDDPRSLKDLISMVASPGGCTVEGLKALDAAGANPAMQAAIEAAVNKLTIKK